MISRIYDLDIKTPKRRTELGFSVIEVVLVVVVIGILAVTSIPQIFNSLQAYRLDSTAGSVADGAMAARLAALKYNRAASVKINPNNSAIEIWTTQPNNNQPVRLKTIGSIPQTVSLVEGSSLEITFNSLGRNQANASSVVQFRIPGTSYCKSVIVSAVGNITSAGC